MGVLQCFYCCFFVNLIIFSFTESLLLINNNNIYVTKEQFDEQTLKITSLENNSQSLEKAVIQCKENVLKLENRITFLEGAVAKGKF